MTNTLKTTEIAEAVHAFALSGFDAQAMRPLMELVEAQTDYVQKRFWKLVDAQREPPPGAPPPGGSPGGGGSKNLRELRLGDLPRKQLSPAG